jgi:hypothetical protein
MTVTPAVTELQLVVTAPDYEQPLAFCRDVLGLPERATYESPGGRVTILESRAPPSNSPTRRTPEYIDQAAKPPGIAVGSGLVLYFWGCHYAFARARSAASASPQRIWGLSPTSLALAARRATRPPTA